MPHGVWCSGPGVDVAGHLGRSDSIDFQARALDERARRSRARDPGGSSSGGGYSRSGMAARPVGASGSSRPPTTCSAGTAPARWASTAIIAESGVGEDDALPALRVQGRARRSRSSQQREERWTRAWLQAEVERARATPAARLLAIFDVFGEWFAREDFEGCSFINVMLEVDRPPSTRCARRASSTWRASARSSPSSPSEAGVARRRRLRAPVAHPHEGLDRRRRRGRPRCRRAERASSGALLLAAPRRLRSRRPSSSDAIAAPFDAGRDLLHRDVAREVRRAVLRLHVAAERREAAVVGRAEALRRDVLGRGHQLVADLLGRLDLRVERVDDAR